MRTNRQPKGVPVGGQFAADTHAEPSLSLAAEAPRTRDELVTARRELSAQIGAMDVTAAAKALKKRFPGARGVVAHLNRDASIFGNGIEAQEVWITGPDGSPIWRGPRAKVAQLGTLILIPDPYESGESPLRTSRINHHNGRAWHHYSLEKMAAITPEDLTKPTAGEHDDR